MSGYKSDVTVSGPSLVFGGIKFLDYINSDCSIMYNVTSFRCFMRLDIGYEVQQGVGGSFLPKVSFLIAVVWKFSLASSQSSAVLSILAA